MSRGQNAGMTLSWTEPVRSPPSWSTCGAQLHRVPELDRDLPKTQALVLEALEGLDLEVTRGRR